MEIKIHDNGKGKHESFCAYMEEDSGLSEDIVFVAHGESKEEAIKNLKELVVERVNSLQVLDYRKTMEVDSLRRQVAC